MVKNENIQRRLAWPLHKDDTCLTKKATPFFFGLVILVSGRRRDGGKVDRSVSGEIGDWRGWLLPARVEMYCGL